MKKIAPYILALLLITVGCGGVPPAPAQPVATAPEKPAIPTEPCRFCGRAIPEGTALARPLLVALDNAPPARPQSGLTQACLVYEVPVEGGLTRLLAVFGHRFSGNIGPVRSIRPSFAILALEHGGILAYCGSSPRGEAALRELKIAHINEISNSQGYFRKRERQAPHNLYSNIDRLLAAGERLRYLPSREREPVFRTGAPPNQGGDSALNVQIGYSGGARSEYVFDQRRRVYLRSSNGKPHLDAEGEQLAAGNLVVQFIEIKPEEPDSERLDMSLIGRGDGYYFANGQAFPLSWRKREAATPTRYTVNGVELVFAPGTTWIHLVSASGKSGVTFE